jgi:uncharacterized protein (DUF983 family)
MGAAATPTRTERGLRAADPRTCPTCGAATFRHRFHWPSAVRCEGCGAKVEECRCREGPRLR